MPNTGICSRADPKLNYGNKINKTTYRHERYVQTHTFRFEKELEHFKKDWSSIFDDEKIYATNRRVLVRSYRSHVRISIELNIDSDIKRKKKDWTLG